MRTVLMKKGWEPIVVDRLFLDDKDHHGLLLHYQDIVEEQRYMEESLRKAREGWKK
ncbi:MAG: hypothetical protein KF744_09085 [Taibaiella sp.]|nr:hypothetical protein [Taibaiella sp.]